MNQPNPTILSNQMDHSILVVFVETFMSFILSEVHNGAVESIRHCFCFRLTRKRVRSRAASAPSTAPASSATGPTSAWTTASTAAPARDATQ